MSALSLIPARDAHFAWMLDETNAPEPLRVAPGGVDSPYGLAWNRELVAAGGPTWLIVDGDEIVGLLCRKGPPKDGTVEIGYRIGEARRRRGYATAALRLAVDAAKGEPGVRRLVAETLPDNVASQRVLERNGFARTGHRIGTIDGELICWVRELTDAAEGG